MSTVAYKCFGWYSTHKEQCQPSALS